MPASNARALDKARTLAADGLIFDLEDAVAPAAKAAARAAATAAIKDGGYGAREILIRVNALGTPWTAEDFEAVALSGAHGVVLPKVNGPDDIAYAENLLTRAPDDLALWVMMETPRSILFAREIAGASTRLAGFIAGTNDLAKDLHCAHPSDRASMTGALQTCVLAARAFDLAVIDGVHPDLNDREGFDAACRQGRAFGFDGKSLIHPDQISVANNIFAPSAEDLARAHRIVAAHEAARASGAGVTLLDGRLVESLHVIEAERLIGLDGMIAAR